jgi:hypothetical protein
VTDFYKSKITVIGLDTPPDLFLKALSMKMFDVDIDNLEPNRWGFDPGITSYRSLVEEFQKQGNAKFGVLYSEQAFELLGFTAPRFYVETKYEAPIDELRRASNKFPELTFHLKWRGVPEGPSGEIVIRCGACINELFSPIGQGLFDEVLYPSIGLLPAHLPYTLAQRASLRLEHAIEIVESLVDILDDHRFRHSESRPFSDCRDSQKTSRVRADLKAIYRSLVTSAHQINFERVFLEEEHLSAAIPRVIEQDGQIMRNLGLNFVRLEPDKVFSILPFKWAHLLEPDRIILPVVSYPNRNTGFPKKEADHHHQHWETGYLYLHLREMRRIGRAGGAGPCEGACDPCGVDFVAKQCAHGFGYGFECVSQKAQWTLNVVVAKQVMGAASNMEVEFAARLGNVPGIAIFESFQELDELPI